MEFDDLFEIEEEEQYETPFQRAVSMLRKGYQYYLENIELHPEIREPMPREYWSAREYALWATANLLEPNAKLADTKPHPIWVLILFKTGDFDPKQVKDTLIKAIPEMGVPKAEAAIKELMVADSTVIWRAPKEVIEHYYEIARSFELLVRAEPEA